MTGTPQTTLNQDTTQQQPVPSIPGGASPQRWRILFVHFLVFLGIVFGVKLGQAMTLSGDTIMSGLIWPNAGLGLAVVTLGGFAYLIPVFLGNVVGYFVAGTPIAFLVFQGLAYTAGAAVGAAFLRHFMRDRYALERIREVGLFLSGGVLLAPMVSSLLSIFGFLLFFSHLAWRDFGRLLLPHWLADAVGVMIVAPIILVWSDRARMNWRNSQLFEVLLWLVGLIVVGVSVFGNWAPTDTLLYPLELALFPLMAWAAVRFGQKGSVAGMVILSMMAILQLLQVLGPEHRFISQSPYFLWTFMGVLGGTTFFLGAVTAEMKNREQAASENEMHLRGFTDALPDIAFVVDEAGVVTEIFSSEKGLFRDYAECLRREPLYDMIPSMPSGLISKTLDSGNIQNLEYPLELRGKTFWFESRLSPLEPSAEMPFQFGRQRRVICASYEISRRKEYEATLESQEKLLQASASAKNTLLTVFDYEQSLNQVLATIGPAMKADRILIFENYRDRRTGDFRCGCRFEWAREGMAPIMAQPESLAVDYQMDLPGCLERLGENEMVYGNAEAFPSPIPENLSSRGIRNFAQAPIFLDQVFWGFLGVEFCQSGRDWTQHEINVLRLMAGSIGGFLKTKRNEEALKEAKVAADEANAAKSEFLAMMSHEIRTPMNAILGFADLMNQTGMQEDQREYLEIIQRSGKALLELINNILDYSKIESRRIDLELTPFSLEQVICEVLEMVMVRAKEKGVHVDFEIIGEMPELLKGDPHRIRQIFLNLVNNAVKFTTKGNIWVKAEAFATGKPNQFQIHNQVVDTGIGISPSKIKKLFRPFTQVDSSTTRQFGGTGLGLVISKRLSERMGGKMWVESEEGQGSTFHFTMILDALAPEANPDVSELTAGSKLDSEFARHFPLKILLAEDEPVNQMIAEEILKQLGYQVRVVPDGAKALEAIQEGGFDLVLMDIHMPEMDGWEVTRKIRSGSAGEHCRDQKIVALTAFALDADKKKCLEAGMDDYLSKPIEIGNLKQALERAYQAL